ncbi:TPA: restriction endonuclease subunit S [Photobacterium damselae]|nr:restriction endonuclease subunit S [Photobacterium damselae]
MSWPLVKLDTVISFIRGVTFKPDDQLEPFSDDSIVVMRTKNVQVEGLDISDLIAIPKKLVKRNEQILLEGDILISSANSWELVGKSSYVNNLDFSATAGGFISIVRAKESLIYPKYLYHWIMNPKNQHSIRYCGRKTTNISNLDVSRFKELKIPLPPLKEQQRIAAILDKADAIRQKRKQAIELADEFLRSVFLDMFGDPVTNPKGWEVKPLNKFTEVVTGNTPPRKDPENYGEHIEWIKSDNINTPSHYLTEATEKLSEQGKMKGRAVMEGAVLMTCIAGSLSCIGNIAIADREVTFNQQINAIVPTEHSISEYIYGLMLVSKNQIQEHSTNAMKGMISKGVLSAMTFPCPPKVEQQKYAKVFQSYMTTMNNLNSHSQQSNELFNSLSQKAFSGQL